MEMGSTSLLVAATAIGALAFLARTAVLFGREPGGVDSWYYLAYARAFRKAPGLRVSLPQYLLQDLEQSYAPVFPSLLAILPERILARSFWAISPGVDCLTLIMLFLLALKLTAEPTVALIATLAYAVSPTLISETRALTPRSFGVFLHALSLVLLLRAVLGVPHWTWTAAALLSGALLFLSSATAMASYIFVAVSLSLAFTEPRYLALPFVSMVVAWVLSAGHLGRVFANYVHAVRFWVRQRKLFGSHPILDAPVYGGPRPRATSRPQDLGFLGQGFGPQMLRLLGENPFLLVLPLAKTSSGPWFSSMFVWAASLSAFGVIATVVWPLRAFGPGRSYMKSAIFPTAYVLAAAIGTPRGLLSPTGLATLTALGASILSVAFFLVYTRGKKNELTAHVPSGLRALTDRMASLPEGSVACLPGGYSDYVTYRSGRSVLWGSHSGSLDKFELVSPVWRERVEVAARRFGVRYLIVERAFVDPSVLNLDPGCELIGQNAGFDLFDLQASPAVP
ncbi:MAG: hypothetical protein JJE39_08000 [Vicinamibacteria bacterium]|nr:hypothetical protein [Vicinamibacteria bacterium]